MVQNNFKDEHIIALNRLLQYSAYKKFLIHDNSISHKNIGNKAIEITDKIVKEFNIDIFRENDKTKIIQFEYILGDLFSKYVSKMVSRNINDEAELIINSKNIDISELDKYEIIIPEPFKRHVVRYLPVEDKYLLQICRNPDFVSCIFPIESYSDFIFTSLVKIDNIKRVLLAHLNRYSSRDLKTLKVSSLFAFKYDLVKHLFQNPIRLFLWALNMYGVDISFSGETKRFFRKTIAPTILPYNTPEKNLRSHITGIGRNDIYYASYYARPSLIGISYEILYAVNLTKFLQDFKAGRI